MGKIWDVCWYQNLKKFEKMLEKIGLGTLNVLYHIALKTKVKK